MAPRLRALATRRGSARRAGNLRRLAYHSRRRAGVRPLAIRARRDRSRTRTRRLPPPPMADSRDVRDERRHPHGSAHRRDAGGGDRRQPDGSDILAGLHERGGQPRFRALLRLHGAVHRLDGRACAGVGDNPGVRVLGAGRALLVSAHRILAHAPIRRRRRQKGVHRNADRGFRIPARHTVSVLEPRGAFGGRSERA